jgi:hypothetical protein
VETPIAKGVKSKRLLIVRPAELVTGRNLEKSSGLIVAVVVKVILCNSLFSVIRTASRIKNGETYIEVVVLV